ncbi:MAG: tetratricopeptide repeat protein [Chloroflexi bacterium]|nr:tetratricopeptide repeat protein [Chloroflexota bacterium]
MRLAARFSILALPVFLFAAACSGSDPLPTATPTATPSATVTPTATPVPAPTSVPTPTLTPAPPATPTPSPTARPASAGLFDYSRAIRLLEIQEFTQAIAAFGLVLRRLPDFAEAYRGRGIAYYKEDLFDLALEDFDKAIELKPGLAGAYADRAVVFQDRDETEKAIADFEKAISVYDPIRDGRRIAELRAILGNLRP